MGPRIIRVGSIRTRRPFTASSGHLKEGTAGKGADTHCQIYPDQSGFPLKRRVSIRFARGLVDHGREEDGALASCRTSRGGRARPSVSRRPTRRRRCHGGSPWPTATSLCRGPRASGRSRRCRTRCRGPCGIPRCPRCADMGQRPPVGRHGPHFRAYTGAACFKTSTSIRSLRFSRSGPRIRFCSGVRLSAARGEPVAFIDLTRLSTVLLPRSHSSMASRLGLPALWRSTIFLLNSSVKCLGLGPVEPESPVRLG